MSAIQCNRGQTTSTEILEAQIPQLEHRLQDVEKRFPTIDSHWTHPQRGWRAFIGVDGDNPDFEEAVLLGREWRFADSPKDDAEAR